MRCLAGGSRGKYDKRHIRSTKVTLGKLLCAILHEGKMRGIRTGHDRCCHGVRVDSGARRETAVYVPSHFFSHLNRHEKQWFKAARLSDQLTGPCLHSSAQLTGAAIITGYLNYTLEARTPGGRDKLLIAWSSAFRLTSRGG